MAKTYTHTLTALCFVSLMLWVSPLSGQLVTGSVTDIKGNPIAYASVYLQGNTKGTTTNTDGKYQLELSSGSYEIICAHIGFERQVRKVVLGKNEQRLLDFTLKEQEFELNEVVVQAGAEDPAYQIIRNAIAARSKHLNEVGDVQSNVYIKGLIRSIEVPKKIFGRKVTTNDDIIDSTGKGIIYFSESLTRYSKRKNGETKEEVVSAKVSGNSQGFGFNSPESMELNFYENNLRLQGLNSRGFVSPINDNALNFYRYKYLGSFYEDGLEINKIAITPKRLYEPLFAGGEIQIIEGSWRIHSADVYLTKTSQIELVDTLRITQELAKVNTGSWLPQYTRFQAGFGIFGFKAAADFAAVYSEYNLQPLPAAFWKDNIVKIIDTSANKKTIEFWDTLRPIPLSAEEAEDYVKKDSLEKKFKSPEYLDSLDKISNKFSVLGFLVGGQSYSNRYKKTNLSIPGLINTIQYNTVEQWVVDLEPTFSKRTDTGAFSISPRIRYSTASNRFNMDAIFNKRIGKNYNKRWNLTLAGGRNIFQINPSNPIVPLNNSFATLVYNVNYMKIYEKGYGSVAARKTIGRGLSLLARVSYEDRNPLENTDTTYRWRNYKDRSFTSNYPEELPPGFFERHQAFITTTIFTYQPGVKYMQYPNRLISVSSDKPVFTLTLSKAWRNFFGSDAEFGKWSLRMRDGFNMKLGGEVKYAISVGGFVNNRKVQLPDWQHFMGNQTIAASPYVNSFQLAPYYANSTRDRFFSTGHLEWNLNGLISNKIPGMRQLKWGLVTGTNAFYIDQNRNYSEVFVGITNIFKIFRVDYVWGWDGTNKRWTNGLVIGAGGLLTGDGVD